MSAETGKLIHDLRAAKGYTLEELGNLCGVSKSTVRKWETGDIANMRQDKIAKLASALGVSVKVILGMEESPKATTKAEEFATLVKTLTPEQKIELAKLLLDSLNK